MTTSRGSDEGFDDVLRYVEDNLAFSTSHYNESYLDRRITARIRRTDVDSYDEYRRILRADPSEQEALLDSLSINVTSFFRNPAMWEELRHVLRELTRERRRVRVWSAPCSDGREPYSVAMLALDDPSIDDRNVSITGTDISDDALEVAKAGRYTSTRTTDIAEELAVLDDHSKYVERDGDRFQVTDRVRSFVEFDRCDLIRDDPPGAFDLVLCRNLFIYISADFKEPILRTLDGALVAGGYLVIGMTETLHPAFRSVYRSVDRGSRIYQRSR